jgi:UDPglucose 6-dehydrogenase
MHVTTAASQANIAQQDRFVRRVAKAIGGLDGKRIGLLGLAFKAGTDDIRDSPAIRIARGMIANGAVVIAYDPAANELGRRAVPELEMASAAEHVFEGADAVVVATEWPEFRQLAFEDLRPRMRVPVIVDGRLLLDREHLSSVGFVVSTLGTSEQRAP